MVTKTEALKNLLPKITWEDLADLYNDGMEIQVMVAQDNGDQIHGEFKGRRYRAFSDGLTTWKHFRIPWNANKVPEYEDSPIHFDLAEHYEGIGMTGWNWKLRQSIYVAYDFDSLVNHNAGLTAIELDHILEMASGIPWISVRRSTSGTGFHLYVFLEDVYTENHTEHAAVARAILAKMSSITGFDFRSKVDTCGGNMWIAHRKMDWPHNPEALALVKEATEKLKDIPTNWRDHLKVVKRKSKKIELDIDTGDKNDLEALINQRFYNPLDEQHRKIIQALDEFATDSWWDNDHHLLVTHTWCLKQLHEQLNLRGIFDTLAEGSEKGADHNCFMFPLSDGAWVVRRFTPSCEEKPSWFVDSSGWTTCHFNRNADLATLGRHFSAIETEKGEYIFNQASVGAEALSSLGTGIDLPLPMLGRKMLVKEHKDGRLVVRVHREASDDGGSMLGWDASKKDYWTRIFNAPHKAQQEPEIGNFDQIIRHLVTEDGADAGWVIKGEESWNAEPLTHIKLALTSMGFAFNEVNAITGNNITRCWKLVNRPFDMEYPGNRMWNRSSPQFTVPLKDPDDQLAYDTWKQVIRHCAHNLDEAVVKNTWCQNNGILTGYDYLKCWIASVFQEPLEPLPFLFFYGSQNCGKSIFHEAISLLFTPGYVRADTALINPSGFNGELENAVLCVVEETNLQANKTAYNRIKDWVTSVRLPIHKKQKTPIHVPNTTHWVQCANEQSACPIFPGDTRIIMARVSDLPPEALIPKRILLNKLREEASDFLTELLNLEIPQSNDRLNLPVLTTEDKINIQRHNQNPLENFLEEYCYYVPGEMIPIAEFQEEFHKFLDVSEISIWTKPKISKSMPLDRHPKGRRSDATWCYGNISFTKGESNQPALYVPIGSDKLTSRSS